MTKRRWTILLAAILLGSGLLYVLFVRDRVQEGRCRLILKKADPQSRLIGWADQLLLPLSSRPESVRDLPTGFERPGYYEIRSGGRLLVMVVDFSQRAARLCIDTDGDGLLSEERCFTAKPCKETPVSDSKQQFGPIPPIPTAGAGKVRGGFYVRCYRADAPVWLFTYPAFFRTGKLLLAGRIYPVAVVDADFDGLFNSILSLPRDHSRPDLGCDVLGIDLDHDGTFEFSLSGASEIDLLGRLLRIDGVYYAFDFASDGTSLALSRTEPQLGTLAVQPNDATVELRLTSDAAGQHLPDSWEQKLPIGKYRAVQALITKRDASGDIWTVSSSPASRFHDLGPLEYFEIRPGETTSIRIGPPFIVRAGIHKRHSGRIEISPVIVGCAGEEYAGVLRQGQTRLSPVPFKIVDEQGNVVIADNFTYT